MLSPQDYSIGTEMLTITLRGDFSKAIKKGLHQFEFTPWWELF